MKKAIILILVSLFTLSSFILTSNASDVKLGYVDLNRALNESNAGMNASKELADIVKSKQKLIAEKEERLNNLKNEITSQTAVLSSDALKKKQEEHDELVKSYQRMVQDSKEEVQKKQSGFMKDIIISIRQIITDYGKSEGYTAIFERIESGLLYMAETTDLTDMIINKFNEKSAKN